MRPRWVPKAAVLAIHERLLAEHGGPPGMLDEGALEAAPASPRNHLAYGNPDVYELAAAYAFALTRNHPFQDGNKRVALTVAGVFFDMNGFPLEASERDAANAVTALSARDLDAPAFAAWLRMNSSKLPPRRRRAVRRVRADRKPRSQEGRRRKR